MNELYKRTVERLGRCGIKDPTAQIIALAEEIEGYREHIRVMERHFSAKTAAGGCRPCEVDGKPAVFHRWVDDETGALIINFFAKDDMVDRLRRKFKEDGVVPAGCSLEKLHQTLALIEWPGGTVETVPVSKIRFTDKEG